MVQVYTKGWHFRVGRAKSWSSYWVFDWDGSQYGVRKRKELDENTEQAIFRC